MKKFKFLPLWALALAIGFAGCNDDPDGPVEIIEDGYYVVGEAAASTTIVANGKMTNGINEADQKELAGLYDKYVALEAGKTFKIMKKAGVEEASYGGVLAVDTLRGEESQIGGGEGNQVAIQKGALIENGAGFQVPGNGLYQIVVYETTAGANVFVIPVEWQLNGVGQDAEDGGGYKLVAGAFNKETMTFTLPSVKFEMGSKFKVKNHDGWKVKLAEGVFINCNFGLNKEGVFKYDGSNNSVLPGGADIVTPISARGYYTITLTWTLGTGWSHTLKLNKESKELPALDFTQLKLQLIGAAVDPTNPGAVEGNDWNWGSVLDAPGESTPSVSGNTYTWTWESVSLLADEFKIRTIPGSAPSLEVTGENIEDGSAPQISNNNGNLKVSTAGAYKIVVTIDEIVKVKITKL